MIIQMLQGSSNDPWHSSLLGSRENKLSRRSKEGRQKFSTNTAYEMPCMF